MKTNTQSSALVSKLLRRWEMVSRVLALTPSPRTAQKCKARLCALDCALSRLSVLVFAALVTFGAVAPTPARAEVVTMWPRGVSMLPALPAEPSPVRVDIAPAAFSRITVGAVVIVADKSSPTGLICHRVFEVIAPGVYWTRGDNCRRADPFYLTAENFRGLVVSPVPAKAPRTWGERLAARKVAKGGARK